MPSFSFTTAEIAQLGSINANVSSSRVEDRRQQACAFILAVSAKLGLWVLHYLKEVMPQGELILLVQSPKDGCDCPAALPAILPFLSLA